MKHRRTWIVLAIVVLLAAAGGGTYWWRTRQAAATVVTDTGETLHTATARRGNLEIVTTAAGTVVASVERTLGFDTPSELLDLYVSVGQVVAAGDVLARVDDLSLRQAVAMSQAAITRAEVSLQEAQDKLASLDDVDQAVLLTAQASLASAQSKLADLQAQPTAAEVAAAEATLAAAQEAYQSLIDGPTADELQEAQWSLDQAKNGLWSSQMSRDAAATGRGYDQAQVGVLNAEISVAKAEMNLRKLQEPASAVELAQARASVLKAQEDLADIRAGAGEAELASAQAAVIVAQEDLDDLQDGATATEQAAAEVQVTQAELDLEQARLDLETAQRDLAAATLTAPIAGTVMSISAEVGEDAAASFITIADLSRPVLEVYVDETDMPYMKVGFKTSIAFDALPDETFSGEVIEVDPGLSSSVGMSVVHGLVAMDEGAVPAGTTLPTGLSATVDIIAGSAQNAVLVPVEALRELDTDQYAVFVMTDDAPVLRLVKVGLIDVTYAEIVSGLEVGDVVTTGLVEVQ